MTLGQFIFRCLKSAGDSGASQVSVDEALTHVQNSLAAAASQFTLHITRTYSLTANQAIASAISRCPVSPTRVKLNDVVIPHANRLDDSATSGWYQEGSTLYIIDEVTLGDEVEVMGTFQGVPLLTSDLDNELVVIDPGADDMQWVPPGVEDLVRYNTIAKICEDMKRFESAQYYSARAEITKRDLRGSLPQSKTSMSVIQAWDVC